MHRLIERGLMFGNLVRVDSPVWVERYNRALEHLTGRTTALEEFHIDISGFSPEVGDELGDPKYLNARGVNRQFILLTTDQESAPLLDATFSSSRGILKQFIAANRAALFALTAQDAVAGELVTDVLRIDSPARLFDFSKVRIEADTTRGTVRGARELGKLIERFRTEPDGWYDDVLIARMIGLAKETGDVTRNPVSLQEMTFAQDNFWTSHFGGLYVFRGVRHPAVISAGPKDRLGEMPIPHVFDFGDRAQIAKFLALNELVEPVAKARGIDAAAILRQKMDFIVAEVAARSGVRLDGASRRDLRRIGRAHAAELPAEWQDLAALVRWAEEDAPWPRITSDDAAYFYTLRATDHPDADLVNMLLAELSPLDIRQLFICHKEAFYAAYATWPDAKREYVADFLQAEYQVDKAGTRAALFGHEAPMAEPAAPPPIPPRQDLIDRVGPWGAVKRRGPWGS